MSNKEDNQANDRLNQAVSALRRTPIPPGPCPEVIQAVLDEAGDEAIFTTPKTLKKRIITMKKITKIAAILIFIAGIAGLVILFTPGADSPGAAWAKIIKPILTARTGTYKLTVDMEGAPTQRAEGMFLEPGRLRQEMPGGGVQVIDMQQCKIVTLIPPQKLAMVWEMQNVTEDDLDDINIFSQVRRRISEAENMDDSSVEYLGEKQIDGRTAIGYHVRPPGTGMDLTIWAEPETLLPIRMEYTIENIAAPKMSVVISDIVFDVPLDESLFSLEIPEDYRVQNLSMDTSPANEEDLINMLRFWAENTDGQFPSVLESKVVMEFVEYQKNKYKEQGREPNIDDVMALQQDIANHLVRGGMFVQQLTTEGNEWHYAGKDATYGDANTAIFWYQPAGSETWRVIYADLHVEDVAAEYIPAEPENTN